MSDTPPAETTVVAGRRIVVTRPAQQAAHLCEQLVAAGARPVRFPVLEITPVEDVTPLQDAAIALDGFDLVVFVSPNAVELALATMLAHRTWPPHVRAGAMGLSSEAALAKHGVAQIIAPRDRFDSEALLALPELQAVHGWRVLVCRGDGGRELLGDTLQRRGAAVTYLTCYRRSRPALDPAPLLALWERRELDAVTLTSSEGVDNFIAMSGPLGLAWLRETPTFVSHARIVDAAARHGLRRVIATGPGDAGIMAGLRDYFAANQSRGGRKSV